MYYIMDSNIDNDIKDLKNRIKVFKKNLRKHCDKLNSTDVSTTTSVPSSPTSSTDTTTIGPDGSRRTNLSTRRMRDRVTFAPGTATPPVTSILSTKKVKIEVILQLVNQKLMIYIN